MAKRPRCPFSRKRSASHSPKNVLVKTQEPYPSFPWRPSHSLTTVLTKQGSWLLGAHKTCSWTPCDAMLPRLSYSRPSYFSTCQEVPREDGKRREGWPQKGAQHSKLHLTYYFSNPNCISHIISAIQITSQYYFINPNYISVLFQQAKLHLSIISAIQITSRYYFSTPNCISHIISAIQITSHVLFQQSKLHLTYYSAIQITSRVQFQQSKLYLSIISAIQITSQYYFSNPNYILVLFQQSKLHLTYYFSNPNYISRIISAIQITSHVLFQQSKLRLSII